MKKYTSTKQKAVNWNDIVEWKKKNDGQKIKTVIEIWPSTIDRIGITRPKRRE